MDARELNLSRFILRSIHGEPEAGLWVLRTDGGEFYLRNGERIAQACKFAGSYSNLRGHAIYVDASRDEGEPLIFLPGELPWSAWEKIVQNNHTT